MEVRLRTLLLSFLPLLGLLVPLAAQGDDKFTLTAAFEPATARPGDEIKLVLKATTAPGWHAYGTNEMTNIPVSLEPGNIKTNGLELAGPAQIPPGIPKLVFTSTQYPLPGSFQVVQPMKVPAGASGAITVTGALGYQICDESMCERPNEAPFSATLQVAGTAAGGAPSPQEPVKAPELGTKPPLMLEPDGLQADGKVSITAKFDPASVRAGETTTLIIHVKVIDGWHAYGALEETNVPVRFDELKQDVGDLEFVGEGMVPDGHEKETPIGPSYPLPQEFDVKQVFRVPAGTEAGEIQVSGALDYQVCDEGGCDPETEGDYEAALTVEEGDARAEMVEPPTIDEPDEDDNPFSSWWALILASIGGGLFALAMPCTYPMIPITFSFFTKQAEKRGGNVLPLTIVYGLGIISMFVFVGTGLSLVIIDVVNHWLTNLIIGFMFFFFAFVLFGWVNLNPPQWMQRMAFKAQSTAQGESQGGGGWVGALIGVFFMGATLVITSFTCTAPIVGSLIANVAKLGTLRVGIGMAIFGLTMAIPFMVLSLMPNKVKAMPKSGEWMDTLKISLGFVELAAAFKFVSMVDFYFGWQALPRELFLMLWAAIFGLWAMFLFGILRKAGTINQGVSNGRMASGMLITLLAAYFYFGAIGNKLDAIMTSFIPGYTNSLVMKGGGEAKLASKHIIVKDDPDGAMARARAEDKMLLYNFTGFN